MNKITLLSKCNARSEYLPLIQQKFVKKIRDEVITKTPDLFNIFPELLEKLHDILDYATEERAMRTAKNVIEERKRMGIDSYAFNSGYYLGMLPSIENYQEAEQIIFDKCL